MKQVHVHVADGQNTASLLRDLDGQLEAHSYSPRIAFLFYGCELDDARIYEYLTARFPQTAILGGSSSGGVMTHRGITDARSLALMLIDDEDGDYGVAAGRLATS